MMILVHVKRFEEYKTSCTENTPDKHEINCKVKVIKFVDNISYLVYNAKLAKRLKDEGNGNYTPSRNGQTSDLILGSTPYITKSFETLARTYIQQRKIYKLDLPHCGLFLKT